MIININKNVFKFWNPHSGFIGGIMLGAILMLGIAIIRKLIFSFE